MHYFFRTPSQSSGHKSQEVGYLIKVDILCAQLVMHYFKNIIPVFYIFGYINITIARPSLVKFRCYLQIIYISLYNFIILFGNNLTVTFNA